MSFYRIQIDAFPSFDYLPIDKTVQLTDEQVHGIVAAAKSVFEDEINDYLTITDQSGRILEPDIILDQENAIVLDGEAAFELEPERDRRGNEKAWVRTIEDAAILSGKRASVTKNYTVKAYTEDGSYVFQFNDEDFLRGMFTFFNEIGEDPRVALVYLHQGNRPLNVQ